MPLTYSPFPRPLVTTVWSDTLDAKPDKIRKLREEYSLLPAVSGQHTFLVGTTNKYEYSVWFTVNTMGNVMCVLNMREDNPDEGLKLEPSGISYTNMIKPGPTVLFRGDYFPDIGKTVILNEGEELLGIVLIPYGTESYTDQRTFAEALKALKPDLEKEEPTERLQELLLLLNEDYNIVIYDMSGNSKEQFDIVTEYGETKLPEDMLTKLLPMLGPFL